MAALVADIDRILEKHSKENLISREDVSLLARELSMMHGELYGNYEEFKEVNMTLMQKIKTRHKEFEKRGYKPLTTKPPLPTPQNISIFSLMAKHPDPAPQALTQKKGADVSVHIYSTHQFCPPPPSTTLI